MVSAEIWLVEILRLSWNLSAFGESGTLLSALPLLRCIPALFSPQESSPLLCCPVSCLQFGMLPSGNAIGGKQRDALASQSQALTSTSTAPQLRLPLLPLPLPTPQVASIKRIMEQKDEREGITGNYQP